VESLQLTARDRAMLGFVADHRLVLAAHVAVFAGCTERAAGARLRTLSAAGLLERRIVFHRQAGCYQATAAGLRAAGSSLPRPRLDLRYYMHDVGCAWLWLNARAGAFGAAAEIHSERRLRSHDVRADRAGPPLAVRVGDHGREGAERLHYPDLVVRLADGRRIALELELTGKGRARLERILGGYGADGRIDAVVYLAGSPPVARSLRTSVATLGLGSLISVRPLLWGPAVARLDRHLAGREVARVRPPATERVR
jgi:hypothetical protein